MTLKEQRNNQLDELKSVDNISPVKYRVSLLNGSFKPYQTYEFDKLDEAKEKAKELEKIESRAFIETIAIVRF